MNCELCRKESEAYLGNKLSPGMRIQVEAHLETCNDCKEIIMAEQLAARVIAGEKELVSNPYLSTRIMAEIIQLENPAQTDSPIVRILRPVLLTASLAAAVFTGVIIGSINQSSANSNEIPLELALIDDSRIESVDFLSNE